MPDDRSPDDASSPGPSALGSLQVFARSSVSLAPGLDHVEIYTPHGLLTWFAHRPDEPRAAIVACGTYGFATAAMLVPAIYEFDVATGRTAARDL